MYETNTPAPLPIVPADILDRFHVNEPYDTRFASGARLLQSIWREKRGHPVGKIKPEKGRRRRLGSRLTPEVARTGVKSLLDSTNPGEKSDDVHVNVPVR
jgi:hypothetical protein